MQYFEEETMNKFKAMSKTMVMVSLMLFGLQVYAFGVGEDAMETDSLRIRAGCVMYVNYLPLQ